MDCNNATDRRNGKVQDVGNRIPRREAKDHGFPSHQTRDFSHPAEDDDYTGQTIRSRIAHAEAESAVTKPHDTKETERDREGG